MSNDAEYVLVVGGPKHGERVRWVGPEMIMPIPKSIEPVAYTAIAEMPKPVDIGYTLVRYITWRNERTGEKCYIEENEAKRIEELRSRNELKEKLEARLGKNVPKISEIIRKPYLMGCVWDCYDEECGCSQARIYGWDYVANGLRMGMTTMWEGPFHTDHEPGASEDLWACHKWLEMVAPTIDAMIEWAKVEVEGVW